MRLLNDHFRLHASEVRQLFNQAFVVAGQDSRKSRLNCPRSARGHKSAVALRQLKHLRDALPRCGLELRNIDEVTSGLRHHGFHLGPDERASKHGHGPFGIDHGGDTEFLIWIPGLAKTTDACVCLRRNARGEESSRRRNGRNEGSEYSEETSPTGNKFHVYLRTTS